MRKSLAGISLGAIYFLAGKVVGQSGCGTNGVTRTIGSQDDARALTSCTVLSGSVAIATSTMGSIQIDGVEEILENVVVQSVSALSSLGSESLRRINGNWTLFNVTLLSTISFPALTSVDTFTLQALPAVPSFDFKAGLSSVANMIISNTFLSNLEGLNLKNADNIDISNNNNLKDVNLPLETAKNRINIQANGRSIRVSLPKLTSAGSMILRNISSISMPALSFLSGGLLFSGANASTITAENLTVITQGLSVVNNANLSTISFPELLSAGSIQIANNTGLTSLDFDKVGRLGNVSIAGNITSLDLPGLTTADIFHLESTSPSFNCSLFDANKVNSVIKGDYACNGTHQQRPSTTSLSGENPNPNPTPNSGSGLSGGAIAGIVVGSIAAIAILVAAIWFFRRRKDKSKTRAGEETFVGVDGKAEMDGKVVERKDPLVGRTELDSAAAPKGELPTGNEAHELPEHHGATEVGADERYELPGAAVAPAVSRKPVSNPRR
ncbi:hypothetical protein VTL71DRAFT_12432 [Oculimacula yallundae]|uniref:Uncharacterized protein n=1 Tax=Oculimacula yallundae TaxID=86028 RepID=A0ABR4CMK8_9HELO